MRIAQHGLGSERGIAMMHVLILGAALFGLAVAALSLGRSDLMISNNLLNGTKALWVASAGAEVGKDWLVSNLSNACLESEDGCPIGPQAFGEGTYEITIARHPELASRLRILSIGTAPNNARKIVEEIVVAPLFDGNGGLVQIDGAAIPSDLEDPGKGPGIRIPAWTMDGRGYFSMGESAGELDPDCAEVPPVAGVPDDSETGLANELDKLRCKIVQRANECCLADGTTNRSACVLTPGVCGPGVCDAADCVSGACAVGACTPGDCNDDLSCLAGTCPVLSCSPSACIGGVCATGYCEVSSCVPGNCNGLDCAAGTCEAVSCTAGGSCSPGDPTCVSATCNRKGQSCRAGTCEGSNCVAGTCQVENCGSGSCSGSNCVAATCAVSYCGAGSCPAGASCVAGYCEVGTCLPGDACLGGSCVEATCATTCTEGAVCDPADTACVSASCSLPGCVGLCPFDEATSSGLCEWEPGLSAVRGSEAEPLFDTPYYTDVDLTDTTALPPSEWTGWAKDCDPELGDCCKQMELDDAALRPGPLANDPPRGPLRLDTADRTDMFPVQSLTTDEAAALQAAIESVLDAALLAPAEDKLCITDGSLRGGTYLYGDLTSPKITIVSAPNDQNPKMQALSRSAPCTTGPGDGVNNLVLKDGAVVQGAGVLILPREMDIEDATFDWKGLVVILENGKLVALEDACGDICGGILLQTNNDRNNARLDFDKNEASATCGAPNNAFSLSRCCDAANSALRLLMRTVSWREVFETG